ncbi:MAG: type 3 dihydrofolate reductase [Gammaproteobacteria bacterium]|nr:type 3 dihydrofolate reductase [Gammaproteobacteria bacterium]
MNESRPLISIIVAMAENRVIGSDNALPWHLPADLKHFKAMTLGKPIIMGRKTWESLPGKLPDRTHIIITANSDYAVADCVVVHSLEAALEAAGDVPEVMIVGGAMLYRQALPLADRLYLTLVEAQVEGDAWFPEYDPAQWQEIARQRHPSDGKNPYAYSFLALSRIR